MSLVLCRLLISLIISVVTIVLCYFLVSRDELKEGDKLIKTMDSQESKLVVNDELFGGGSVLAGMIKSAKVKSKMGRKCENI